MARLTDDAFLKNSINFYEELCIIAVNVFVIISSWFLSTDNSYSLKSKRVIRLLTTLFFWYAITSVCGLLLIPWPGWKEVIKTLPLIGDSYDFISGYLVLFLVSPYINRTLDQLAYNSYRKLAVGIFLISSLGAPFVWNDYLSFNWGYSFIWFISIYIIVGFVRKHLVWNRWPWWGYLTMFVILTLFGTIARSYFGFLYVSKGFYNDPVIFLASLSCFLLFASIKLKNEPFIKIIKFCIPFSVAAYFIHANPFIEAWFKSLEVHILINQQTLYYVVCIPLLGIGIYSVCILCDFLREKLFNIIGINKSIDKLSVTIDKHLIF